MKYYRTNNCRLAAPFNHTTQSDLLKHWCTMLVLRYCMMTHGLRRPSAQAGVREVVMHPSREKNMSSAIVYRVGDKPTLDQIVAFRESIGWDGARSDFPAAYSGYLTTVSAYTEDDELVGWVSLVSDGIRHAFFADVIVHPAHQRRGIGRELVSRAVRSGRSKGLTLFHADFASENSDFYNACGFKLGCGGYLDLRTKSEHNNAMS